MMTGLLVALVGCIEVTIPPEAGPAPGNTTGTTGPPVTGPPSSVVNQPDAQSPGLNQTDAGGTGAEDPNAAPPTTCVSNCDCPSGQDCTNAVCHAGEQPIYCCDHPECPSGAACWVDNLAGICP